MIGAGPHVFVGGFVATWRVPTVGRVGIIVTLRSFRLFCHEHLVIILSTHVLAN